MAHQPNTHKKSKHMARRFGVCIGLIAAGVAAVLSGQLLAAEVSKFLIDPLSVTPTTAMLFSYILTQAITIALVAGVAQMVLANADVLGLGKIRDWNYVLLLPLFYVACLMASISIGVLFTFVFSGFDPQQIQNLGISDPKSTVDMIMLGVMLLVVVPLAEEFLFRGYLFGTLRREMPFWLSTIIVSAVFGLAHGQWNVGIDTFILSLALCYLREKTGSIWTGVGLHALKNGVAFVLLFVYNVV